MNGETVYKDKINKRIDYLINNNPSVPQLRGFRYFIKKAPSTTYQYLMVIKNFMEKTGKEAEDLTLDDYDIFLGRMEEDHLTRSYQITAYAALKKFSTYLMANQINDRDPMRYIERPKPVEKVETQEKRDHGYLTKAEVKHMLHNIRVGKGTSGCLTNRERDIAIILVLLSTGMRCSALTKLDMNNINYKEHSIKIIDKGDKIRNYYLPEETWCALSEWIERRSRIADIENESALFIGKRGRLGRDGVSKLVKKYTADIEGKSISPHKLRATYGTQLYEATKDIHFVQKCMGHSSPQTTALYVRGQKNETEEAGKIMSGLFK